MMSKLNVSNNVRKLRFEHGELTQQELANKAGITRQTVTAIETKKYVPSLELAFKLALAFDVSIEKIFFIEEES